MNNFTIKYLKHLIADTSIECCKHSVSFEYSKRVIIKGKFYFYNSHMKISLEKWKILNNFDINFFMVWLKKKYCINLQLGLDTNSET